MDKKKWFLNGGRGSGKSFRLLCETYENKIAELKRSCDICKETEKDKKIEKLEAQIEKMKADVMANIKWADKNCDNMWQKLVKMWNQWEIKEK